MFKCTKCSGVTIKQAAFVKGGHRIVCASCGASYIVREGRSVLDTDTLTQEPEALVFVKPDQYEEEDVVKYPWLETTPEEQFEEMRGELGLPPEVEIPPPGPEAPVVFPPGEPTPGVPAYEHDPQFYKYNMNRLWSYGWDQIGHLLDDDLYIEFALPILTQIANDPESVEQLFTPHGGSQLQRDFLSAILGNVYMYLADRGIKPLIGKGQLGNVEFDYQKDPELADYAYNIMFRKEHPEYLGPMPEYKMDPRAPRRSLEAPYIVELLKKVKGWEEERPLKE